MTSKETEYFILLIESYAAYHQRSGQEIFNLLFENDLIPYVYKMYDLYHIEDMSHAFDDLDERLGLQGISMKIQ